MTDERALSRFIELVRVPTISRLEVDAVDRSAFETFIATLRAQYPLVHRQLELERVADLSLVYRWRGRNPADPTVLMAHYDVVAATDEGWKRPPFAGETSGTGEERELWGRGTADDKGSLAAILEAVEASLEAEVQPTHDIYLCFGHDEETHGSGASAIVDLFEQRGIRPVMVLDEGGAIVENIFPGVTAPIAAVGVAEKGTTLLALTVNQQGGHSSTPPRLSATARLARAILRLNGRPFPAGFSPTAREMFATIGRHATGFAGVAYRNLWWSRPLLLNLFVRRSDETRAMTQTTQAVTLLDAGHAANALPERATAIVNLRVAVGSSVEAAVKHVRRAIRDQLVRVEVMSAGEPSPVSPTHGEPWDQLAATLAGTHPGTVMAPYVQNGATDSRHFTRICTAVYRFTPFELTREERDALHAKNERIHVASWLRGVGFYRALIARL
jgi:carboxypeptidase PM20D1